jgi:hypothetical protein
MYLNSIPAAYFGTYMYENCTCQVMQRKEVACTQAVNSYSLSVFSDVYVCMCVHVRVVCKSLITNILHQMSSLGATEPLWFMCLQSLSLCIRVCKCACNASQLVKCVDAREHSSCCVPRTTLSSGLPLVVCMCVCVFARQKNVAQQPRSADTQIAPQVFVSLYRVRPVNQASWSHSR